MPTDNGGMPAGVAAGGNDEPIRGSLRELEEGSGSPSGRTPPRTFPGTSSGDKVFDPYMGEYGPLVRGRRVQHRPTTASTVTSSAGRGSQKALIFDSAYSKSSKVLHVCRADQRGRDAGRRAARSRRPQGRPRRHLHADDRRSRDGDARLRTHRRDPFGRVRRLCGARACDTHRRFQNRT